MKNHNLAFKLALIITLIGFSTGCNQTKEVLNEELPDFSLSRYYTFTIGTMPDTTPDDVRFSNPAFDSRVRSELMFQVPGKGLRHSNSEPELIFYYYTLPERDEDFPAVIIHYTSSIGTEIAEVPLEDNFVIDVVSRYSNMLLWRGSGELNLIHDEERNRQLPVVIKKILSNLPV